MLNRLLCVTCGLTVLGLLARYTTRRRPTPPRSRWWGLLTLPAFVAMSGLILVFLVQVPWAAGLGTRTTSPCAGRASCSRCSWWCSGCCCFSCSTPSPHGRRDRNGCRPAWSGESPSAGRPPRGGGRGAREPGPPPGPLPAQLGREASMLNGNAPRPVTGAFGTVSSWACAWAGAWSCSSCRSCCSGRTIGRKGGLRCNTIR